MASEQTIFSEISHRQMIYKGTNQLLICTPKLCNNHKTWCREKWTSIKKDSGEPKEIRTSSVFFQDGTSIQELPLIVRNCKALPPNNYDKDTRHSSKTDDSTEENRKVEYSIEEIAIEEGLSRCSSLSEIFKLLDIIPVNEVTPKVAAYALKCISQLCKSENINNSSNDGTTQTFCWSAIIERLCETVRGSSSVSVILEALQALCVGNMVSTLNHDANNGPCQKLINECLLRVAEGNFTLDETRALALVIHSFAKNNKLNSQYVDELWIAILNNYNHINETNISQLFSIVPIFTKSRKTILNMLVKRTLACWWKLTVTDIITILSTFFQIEFVHHSVLRSSTKWLNLNIHTISENDLATIVNLFIKLNHIDSNIIRATEKYIRLCRANLRNMELVSSCADMCVKFRICSPNIMDTFIYICIDHKGDFEPSQIFRIARTFGLLNYIPSNSNQFFTYLENVLTSKFSHFKPDDMIELLLSFTFIQKYPLNFVPKLFNPFFLDRLNKTKDEFNLRKARINLQLLDATLTLECPQYKGPLLMKDKVNKLYFQDVRLTKTKAILCEDLSTILGGKTKFAYSEYPPQLPCLDIYCIDFVIHFDKNGNPLVYSEKSGIDKRKAIIIHLPENFTNEKRHLTGIQATRIRHLKILGYDVIQLEYETIEKLRQRQEDRLRYLQSTILN